MWRLIGVAFLTAVLHASGTTQTVCYLQATITDAQTREPLAGVSVVLDGAETGIMTDTVGIVRVPMACMEHGIRFQRVGYKSFFIRLSVQGETPLKVSMENIATQIEEIVVSAQNSVRTIETPALGVNMLSMKAVKKIVATAGEVDIMKSLQMLPGISAVGEGANGINIRGGSVDQNFILFDNMPVFNPSHLLGLFSIFPTDAIREVQIYKGSVPARYGGRVAGVLDVKMSEPDMEKLKIQGGIGLISNRLQVNIPIVKNKLALLTSGRASFNEYLIRFYNKVLAGSVFDQTLPNSKPKFYDFANKLLWQPTLKDHVTFTNYISHDAYRVFNLVSIAGIIPDEATIRYGHRNAALRWNHYFSDRLNLNTQIVRANYQANTTTAGEITTNFDFRNRLNYYNAKTEVVFVPSAKQRINMGLTGTHYAIRPADLIPQAESSIQAIHLAREQALEAALFVSDEYEISPNLLVEAGFRYVHYRNFGPLTIPVYASDAPRTIQSVTDQISIGKNATESQHNRFEPRLALRYKITPNTAVKIGYNRMNQFLQMISNNATPLPDVRWKTADRYVPPTQSDLVSVGYFYNQPSRMWEWSLEGYCRWQRSIFDYLNGASLNINPIVETQLLSGRAKSYGAELLINKKKGVMTGWLAYTYARSLQQITGDFPALQSLNNGEWFRSNIDKPHTLNVVVSFQNEKHNALAFTFVYSTGRPYTAPAGFYLNNATFLPIYTNRNNGRISDYHRLDCSWTITNPSMKKRKGEGSWIISVYNLYGRKNAFSYFFNASQTAFQPYKISVFPNPIFSLTYNFKFGAQ